MIIECKKRAEGYKPIKGNEEEIINHLSIHDYYNYWEVEKDNKRITFRIGGEVFFTNEDNSFFRCETDGRIKHIMKKFEFIYYIAVPFDITNKDILKIFQSQNFVSLKLKKDGVPDSFSKYWILKTTTQTFGITYNDIIVFDKDWEIVDCLRNDQNQGYGGILESNQYIVKGD